MYKLKIGIAFFSPIILSGNSFFLAHFAQYFAQSLAIQLAI